MHTLFIAENGHVGCSHHPHINAEKALQALGAEQETCLAWLETLRGKPAPRRRAQDAWLVLQHKALVKHYWRSQYVRPDNLAIPLWERSSFLLALAKKINAKMEQWLSLYYRWDNNKYIYVNIDYLNSLTPHISQGPKNVFTLTIQASWWKNIYRTSQHILQLGNKQRIVVGGGGTTMHPAWGECTYWYALRQDSRTHWNIVVQKIFVHTSGKYQWDSSW